MNKDKEAIDSGVVLNIEYIDKEIEKHRKIKDDPGIELSHRINSQVIFSYLSDLLQFYNKESQKYSNNKTEQVQLKTIDAVLFNNSPIVDIKMKASSEINFEDEELIGAIFFRNGNYCTLRKDVDYVGYGNYNTSIKISNKDLTLEEKFISGLITKDELSQEEKKIYRKKAEERIRYNYSDYLKNVEKWQGLSESQVLQRELAAYDRQQNPNKGVFNG